jgi:type IV secretory pathway VirD2 relaxase
VLEVGLAVTEARAADRRRQILRKQVPLGVRIEELRPFTRSLMERMDADLGTRLEWVAVDHGDTDNPHTHVVLRGVDQTGRDPVIDRGG